MILWIVLTLYQSYIIMVEFEQFPQNKDVQTPTSFQVHSLVLYIYPLM